MTNFGRAAVRWLDSRQAARTVWIVAVVTLAFCGVLAWKQYSLTGCQAKYAEASNTSQRARAEAAELDRQAQDRLFREIAEDPQRTLEKLRDYNASRAVANAQRAKNPVPPPPSTNCG